LVVADDNRVRVTEVLIRRFLSDLYDGALERLALAGVNAPDGVEVAVRI